MGMRLTRSGWLLVIGIVGLGLGAVWYARSRPPGPETGTSQVISDPPPGKSQPEPCTGGLLGRPLRVGIVTWPGYAGGIVANNGFKPNQDSIYFRQHNLCVEFMLMEDVEARKKAFAQGGKDGVDIVWSTVDFWAN